MTHANYNEALFEEEARVAGIFPVGMLGDTESAPEWLAKLYEEADNPEHSIFKALPELSHDADSAEDWAFALVTSGRSVLIAKFEFCVRYYYPAPFTCWSSGWGISSWGYVVVERFDEIGPAVLAAVRARHEASKAKAGAE